MPNPAASVVTGYLPEELAGNAFHVLLQRQQPTESAEPATDRLLLAVFLDAATHHVSGEVFWRHDGTSVPVESACAPIIQEHAVVGAVVLFWDISERQQAEGSAPMNRGHAASSFRGRGVDLDGRPRRLPATQAGSGI